MEEVLSPRAAAANRRLEIPVLVTALAVFPMLLIEVVATDGWLSGVGGGSQLADMDSVRH